MSRQRSSGDLIADRRFAYAQACLGDGDAAGAAQMAEQVLELTPLYAPAWFLLGQAREALFARSGDPADRRGALSAFAAALDLDPDDALGARVHRAGLGGEAALGAITPAYIRALFDGYAPRFERHLVGGLNYRGPELILAVLDALPATPRTFAAVLDLGCGTGLMGRALGARAGQVVGVDLSPAMLDLARKSGCYARLVEDELTAYLALEAEAWADLVTAADVLIYLGDLGPVLAGIGRVLRAGGLAAVSVQSQAPTQEAPSDASDGVALGPDGRYAHGDAHVRAAASAAGLTIEALAAADVRRERGIGVPGRIVVMRKPHISRGGGGRTSERT